MSQHKSFELLEPRHLLAANVLISEFVAANADSLRDGYGNTSDWIELHNAGDETVDLAGWYLTDDPDARNKWQFPSVPLAPNDYLVVFASGQAATGYVDFDGHLHANFKLAAAGEYLALVDSMLSVVHEFSPTFPSQFEDVSYGFDQTSGQPLFFAEPSPGAANDRGFADVTQDAVAFSHDSGTFVAPMTLTFASRTAGKPIFYTTDGSLPVESSLRYESPISIEGTTQIRARVIEPGRVPGPVTTRSFVRLGADIADFASRLPIMVIDNFGAGPIPDKGWNQTGTGIQQLPRQPASLMLIEPRDGNSHVASPAQLTSRVGIRVRGASSSDFDEPPYSLESWGDGRDNDSDISPLGLDVESDWVLYAPNPRRDFPLIKNTFLFELSHHMGHWAPDFRHVEAFVNTDGGDLTMADHVGLYVFMEKVKRSDSRIDFPRMSPDAGNGGWMLGINRMDPISEDGQPPRNFHTPGPDGVLVTGLDLVDSSSIGDDIPAQYNAYINFDDPNGYEINLAQRRAIEDWMHQMEDVLYGRSDVAWNDPLDGYSKYIDVDSFIDHYILHNFSKHSDALLLSMWVYNPDPAGSGKLTFGPIWDADLGGFFETSPQTERMYRADRLWYDRLFDDPNFMQTYIDRWQELRAGPLSNDSMIEIIDSLYAETGDEVAERDGVGDWSSRLDRLRRWVVDRAEALDEAFVARPKLSHSGGEVLPGLPLRIAGSQGDTYYTLDGTDPRLPDGSIAPQARLTDSPPSTVKLVAGGAPVTAIVPDAAIDATVGETWKGLPAHEPFDDSAWREGTTGVGYDTGMNYDPLIGLQLDGRPRSQYVRIEFDVANPVPSYDTLTLEMRYDDGFVAYLNGQEVARANTRGDSGIPLAFDALALRSHSAKLNTTDSFDVSSYMDLLHPGTNVLAIHGLNSSPNNSDMLIHPELVAGISASANIVVDATTHVMARALVDGQWSGLAEGIFVVETGPAVAPGDANQDGAFDQSDLESVLQAGRYNSNQPASFFEGDWNGDGVFDQRDVVAALQTGNYRHTAQAAFLPTIGVRGWRNDCSTSSSENDAESDETVETHCLATIETHSLSSFIRWQILT